MGLNKSTDIKVRIAPQRRVNPRIILVVILVAAVGTILLQATHAATQTGSIEPETAVTVSGPVSLLSDSTASGGGAIKFNAASGIHTCYPEAFCTTSGQELKINGVNIRNIGSYSAASVCTDWPGIKSHGFNTVRLAVDWPSVEPNQGQYNFTKLDDAVSTAKANGLYVILDAIHTKGNSANMPSWTTGNDSIDKINMGGSAYWQQLAAHYKNETNIIGYDLANEPQQASGSTFNQNRVLSMYNNLIAAVRSVDASKIVMIEPMNGDSSMAGVNWGLITNKSNLVFSSHTYYAGGDDDGYSSSGYATGNFVYDGVTGYTTSTTLNNQIAAHMDTMLNWLKTPRLPLYVGEYGIGYNASGNTDWIGQNVAIFNARDLPRTFWEGCDAGSMSLHHNGVWAPYTNLFTYP